MEEAEGDTDNSQGPSYCELSILDVPESEYRQTLTLKMTSPAWIASPVDDAPSRSMILTEWKMPVGKQELTESC